MQFSKRLAKLSEASLLARLALIVVPLVLLACALSPIGYALSGQSGLMAVLLAFSSCLVGGLIATAVASLLNGPLASSPMAALYELLIGMMFRMGVPMGAALVVLGRAPALRDAGFVFYLLPFFAVSLAIQTAIAAGSHQLSVDEATASKSGSTNST